MVLVRWGRDREQEEEWARAEARGAAVWAEIVRVQALQETVYVRAVEQHQLIQLVFRVTR